MELLINGSSFFIKVLSSEFAKNVDNFSHKLFIFYNKNTTFVV